MQLRRWTGLWLTAGAVAGCGGDGPAGATGGATTGGGTTTSSTSTTTGDNLDTTATTSSSSPTTSTTSSTTSSTSTTSAGPTSSTIGTTTGDSTTGDPPIDDPRLLALVTHAPRVWLHPDEEYFPSTVEFAFASMTRFVGGDTNYWIRSTEALDSPSDELPFFAGDLDDAPVYAYYAEKNADTVDLVYFFWFPYNRGKSVVDTIWGNHVGDWEHITVRLARQPDDTLVPVQVYLSAHSFGGIYEWDQLEHVDTTHPVVYAAWGSHGIWNEPGDHVYMTIGEEVLGVCVTIVCADLTDETGEGMAWDTWLNVAGFDYGAKQGLGDQTWPIWMSEAFTDPGAPPPEVPGSGPIFRWGNPEDCSTLGVDISDLIGVCRLEDGPTGPASKDVWGPELL